ncbi:tetrapyrrole biosynthesis, uroporphyrinogen III synthase [Zopfochytrium polystomum]|nr:tetrapyrrole biosynthesis, uroporphyrinogen III synthase [Zopfochytrium polystomum]
MAGATSIVVLLKERGVGADPYEAAFARAAPPPRSVFVPTIRPRLLDLSPLCDRLLAAAAAAASAQGGTIAGHSSPWLGMAVTSKNGADAFCSALVALGDRAGSVKELFKTIPIFTVGKATATPLNRLGFKTLGSESGKAEALADVIANHAKENPTADDGGSSSNARSVLFLCGDRRLDILPKKLREAGVGVDEFVVYETLDNERFGEDLSVALRAEGAGEDVGEERPAFVVFFSPSGVDVAVPQLQQKSWWGDCKVVAIGPTTAKRLAERGCKVFATASRPDPESLLEIVVKG